MVYIFLAKGFEAIEMITPLDMLKRAGVSVCTVSVTGDRMVPSSQGIEIKADALFADCTFADAQMLILPGGQPGTDNLTAFTPLRELLAGFMEQGKPVGAICAAPMVLGKAGLLKGRKATCYPGCEGELTGAECTEAFVQQDGNLITATGPAAAVEFANAIIRLLCGTEVQESVCEKMMFGRA